MCPHEVWRRVEGAGPFVTFLSSYLSPNPTHTHSHTPTHTHTHTPTHTHTHTHTTHTHTHHTLTLLYHILLLIHYMLPYTVQAGPSVYPRELPQDQRLAHDQQPVQSPQHVGTSGSVSPLLVDALFVVLRSYSRQ